MSDASPAAPQDARDSDPLHGPLPARVAAHQARIAEWQDRMRAGAARPLNLLADGDSWFDYPLTGLMPVYSDVIAQLRRRVTPLILSLAQHGDAMTDLLGVSRRNRLVDALRTPANGGFDAMLFSGGGNDLVGNQFRLWLRDAAGQTASTAEALDETALAAIMGVVRTAYQDLIATRDQFAPNVPIFVHSYDFARPTGEGVCGLGPWLYPSLRSRGWMRNTDPSDVDRGADIVRRILLEFDAMLQALAQKPENKVICVKTQGTLGRADWANELHPTADGFAKIADRFVPALESWFGDRTLASMRAAAAAATAGPDPVISPGG